MLPEATKRISKIISSLGNAAANRNRAMLTKLLARRESTGIRHVLVADKARLSRRAVERRHQSIGKLVIAPSNYLEAPIASVVKRQTTRLDLVSTCYCGRFGGRNQKADFLASHLVLYEGYLAILVVQQARAHQPIRMSSV